MQAAFVYILANRRHGTLYTGVTSDLTRRMLEHKTRAHAGFTAKYGVDMLVWYTAGESIVAAIELEKKIKNRGRQWKIDLIEKNNPNWRDLSLEFLDPATALRSAQDDVATAPRSAQDDVATAPRSAQEDVSTALRSAQEDVATALRSAQDDVATALRSAQDDG